MGHTLWQSLGGGWFRGNRSRGDQSRRNGPPAGLSAAETELWTAYPTGRTVDLTGRDDQVVRASVLARLLVGGCPTRPGFVPAVRLRGARITGRLDVSGGVVDCELSLDRCVLEEAPVFANAKARQLRFANCAYPGFDGGGLHCDGYLSMSGSTITGLVKLNRGQFTGGLRLNHVKLVNEADPRDRVLLAGGLIVEAGMFVRASVIVGGMRLTGARLSGGLFMEGTRLTATGHPALDLDNATISDIAEFGIEVFRDGTTGEPFTADGQIRLRGARVNGAISFAGARLSSSQRLTLHASHIRADSVNLATDGKIEGGLSLAYSRIGVLYDNAASWPDMIFLNGTVYDSLRGTPPEARLNWVGRDPEFHLDPYEELAGWYRRSGHEALARKAQLAKLRAQRQVQRPIARIPGLLLDWAVGYGYRPWRAACWFAVLLASGTVVFSLDHPHQLKEPQDIPTFHASAYTLDLLSPLPLFGQRDHWNPTGWTIWFSYLLIGSGWIFATALIAGATRVLRPSSTDGAL
jgi:hypothetical protein